LVFGGFAFLPVSLHCRPGRRLPVQGLSEGSLGFLDRLPAWQGPGTGLELCHQGPGRYQNRS
jgi:hypothetical protein